MNEQFDESSFYIADIGNKMSLCGHKTECHKCKRKILVQLPLMGIPHHCDVIVCCADCLVIDEEFDKQYPSISEDINKWKLSST